MDDDIKLSAARAHLRALESGITKALSEFYRSTGIVVTDISVNTINTIGGETVFSISVEARL